MTTDKIHPAEKGRNLEEESQVVIPVTQAPAAGQADLASQTYVDDGNGNIVPGPEVGIQAQAEQPVTTQPETTTQQIAFTPPTVDKDTGSVIKEQPAETVVTDTREGVAAPIAEPSEAVKMQDDMAQKIADVESGNAQPQQFEFNWDSGISFADVVRSSDRPKRAILDDYMKWAKATGNPINWFEINQVLGDSNVENNVHQDEEDRKKAERKAKFDALGTFFTHLGNAVGAMGWGGSVKLEDPVKLSERQREIFEKTQALRRQRNKDMMDAYMKQYEIDRKARIDNANAEYKKTQGAVAQQKADDNTRKTDSQIGRNEALNKQGQQRADDNTRMTDSRIKRNSVMNSVSQQNANANSYRTYNPTTSTTYDANGNIVKNTVNTRGGSGKGKPLGIGVGKGKGKSLGLGIGKN